MEYGLTYDLADTLFSGAPIPTIDLVNRLVKKIFDDQPSTPIYYVGSDSVSACIEFVTNHNHVTYREFGGLFSICEKDLDLRLWML